MDKRRRNIIVWHKAKKVIVPHEYPYPFSDPQYTVYVGCSCPLVIHLLKESRRHKRKVSAIRSIIKNLENYQYGINARATLRL